MNRPDSLTGFYMYLPNKADTNLSTRYIRISVMKNGDTIGSGNLRFDSTDTYAAFSVPIQYSDNQLPDSSVIEVFSSGESAGALLPPVNNLIILDDLQLHITVTVVEEKAAFPDVRIYPNPASGYIHIQTAYPGELDYEILGMNGYLILASRLKGSAMISLDKLEY